MVGPDATAAQRRSPGRPVRAGRQFRRGDVFLADLPDAAGTAKSGVRPVVVIQNDTGNRMGGTVIVATITSRQSSRPYPVNVALPPKLLSRASEVRASQIHTLDKDMFGTRIAHLSRSVMARVDEAIGVSLGLPRNREGR